MNQAFTKSLLQWYSGSKIFLNSGMGGISSFENFLSIFLHLSFVIVKLSGSTESPSLAAAPRSESGGGPVDDLSDGGVAVGAIEENRLGRGRSGGGAGTGAGLSKLKFKLTCQWSRLGQIS